ncbi:MAG TPA: ABC transporter substrate-binding protein, partial [Anaeromyxobacteraceae bacterium]|nr:ABC transporter substrate-binding protein [Anaeromyxobacteraceae bacterium]
MTRIRAGAAALAVAAAVGCTREKPPLPAGVLTVSVEQQSSWIRNFNPLTPATAPRWPTLAGVYEPLYVFNSIRGELVPWLATGYAWHDGARRLRVTLRDGVRWSDGKPFGARDVVFTFELLRRFPALDRRGVWRFLAGATAVDERTVDFGFRRVFVPGLEDVVGQLVVPEHVWKHVADPVTFANETPVGTGPFTEVRSFGRQVYELGRNPRYWQPGKPKVEVLRFPAYPGNDRANLALVFDEVDWSANFVPAIDRVYVGRDPENHRYWFPLTGSTIFLYANTTRAPCDDVRVRKALSMAIDRALLLDVALYRYSRPADATALSDAYAAWRDPEVVAEGGAWLRHDLAAANRLLDEAGHARGPDGLRRLRDGAVWREEVLAVSGWSDWVRAAQVIARNLRELGIDASVRTYDFAAWFQRVQAGEFGLTLGWSFEGPTPYTFYRWLMSSATVKPTGEPAMANWHRYGSPRADALLAAFEQALEPAEQRRLSSEL